MKVKNIRRRGFLKKTAGTAAGLIGFPYIVRASALGKNGHVAASERIAMGCIGMGGQGRRNMMGFCAIPDVQAVAVCDVDTTRRNRCKNAVDSFYGNKDCTAYNDFRELLARDDIDMVSIATPDHWHAIPAIMAAKRGMDVFGEKPLSLTIQEGRVMSDTVKRCGAVWSTNTWQRSMNTFRHAVELVQSGRIGKVHTVIVGLEAGRACPPQPEMPIPEGFDYDMWLGQAPWEPYTKLRCLRSFRSILDYSGGTITDWGGHYIDVAQWGMGVDDTGPIEVKGKGEFPSEGLWNTALHYRLECKYAQGWKMIIADDLPRGTRFEGTEGWIFVSREGLWTYPEGLKKLAIAPNEVHKYTSTDHCANFIECVKSRSETNAPIEASHRSISVAHLGNIVMKLGRKVEWDPQKERFINDPEADRMISRPMRSPWHL